MEAHEIEMLAEAIVRKQNEAAERKAADAQAAAEEAAKVAAEQAEKDRIAAEEAAKVAAESARVAAEKKAKIDAVLSAMVGDVFVDPDGAQHRVIGTVDEGVDTVSRDRDGGTVGNWRAGRENTAALADWRKKG